MVFITPVMATPEQVKRCNADELFLIRIVATPAPENTEMTGCGGAYVNCLVDADDLHSAEQKALEGIRAEQWTPTKIEHWEIVCRECYLEDSSYNEDERRESLERVDEAFEHGYAFTFFCWPDDAPDANEENP